MTPAEAVKELAQGLKDPDEVAKRLWEAGVLMPSSELIEFGGMTYCPVARYVTKRTGLKQPMSIGVDSWSVRKTPHRGHMPKVLKEFVQLYDNGDYDNLISEEVRHG